MRNILCIALICFCCCLTAQEYYNDAQVRTHLTVEKKIGKRFGIALTEQNRITNNVSVLSRASLDLGLSFKVNKFLRIVGDYVYVTKLNKYGTYVPRHWYSAGVILRKDIKYWRILYRNIVQVRNQPMNSDARYETRYYDRNKLTVKYEINKRITGYVSEELYLPLNDPGWKRFDRSRSYIGTEISTFKDQQLELYFMFQQQLHNSDWFSQKKRYPDKLLNRFYVYGIAYTIQF
jgi:hypothetical protein